MNFIYSSRIGFWSKYTIFQGPFSLILSFCVGYPIPNKPSSQLGLWENDWKRWRTKSKLGFFLGFRSLTDPNGNNFSFALLGSSLATLLMVSARYLFHSAFCLLFFAIRACLVAEQIDAWKMKENRRFKALFCLVLGKIDWMSHFFVFGYPLFCIVS